MWIFYKFTKDPKNLQFKYNITDINDPNGLNDIFEIFISYKDNKEYIISKNINYNLDIFRLLDNKKIITLEGHKNSISTIRYFINKKNNNEYLISADYNQIVIIWDITNNYKILYQIETKYKDHIYSCLLVFPHHKKDDFIITSTYFNNYQEKYSTKIFSFNSGKFIKYIPNENCNKIKYLLEWYSKKNDKYYIIQIGNFKVLIDNLLEDELYAELKSDHVGKQNSGLIFSKDNNDYLCCSSNNGYIDIWDLYNKKIFKVINTNKCVLMHIIQWNTKYIIVADLINQSFKIIDLESSEVISNIGGQHKDKVRCVKKIYHPKFGESILSSSNDKTIKLWSI